MRTDEILSKAAKTFAEKNKTYGDNYHRAGECLAAMFPNGILLKTAHDHDRFQIFNLILVKLSRYAVQWLEGHQDSIHDAMVYAALLESIDSGHIEKSKVKEKHPFVQGQSFDWGYKSQPELEEGALRELRGGN